MIDNKTTTFLQVINNHVTSDSYLYIQGSSVTLYALKSLLYLDIVPSQISVLIDDNNPTRIIDSNDDATSRNFMNAHFATAQVAEGIGNKINVKKGYCGLNTLIVKNQNNTHSFLFTSPTFSPQVLGIQPSVSPIVITHINEEQAEQHLALFLDYWKDGSDLSSVLIEKLKAVQAKANPVEQYYYVLQHVFHDFQRVKRQESIERSGYFKSEIWKLLYNFQKDAVLGAIDKIEKYGGCIIADSVGLGKTFEALGVMKYYQQRNDRVLVLCPKRLYENWAVYRSTDRRNILIDDRFNYDLLFHTDLTRYEGMSNGVDLENFYWENFDLIVIDESHNFRNNNPSNQRKTRYQRLMEDILKKGVKTKVLLLSATPVNNKLKDLKNQIYFITEDDDKALTHVGINSINEVLRKTQLEFNKWLDGNNDRQDLLNRLDGRYFKMLDLLTIARSRKHIEKYYDTKDIGKFPERLKPDNQESPIDSEGKFPHISVINNQLLKLNMAVYNPTKYIRADKKEEYKEKYDYTVKNGSIFRQESREESLVSLMRVNFLKRLESSIASFTITMERFLDAINENINRVDHFQRNADTMVADISILDIEDDDYDPELLIGNKVQILIQDLDLLRYKDELIRDRNDIEFILTAAQKISPNRDAKLTKLKEVITNKLENPINLGNKKILLFTAFADTATYLYDQLVDWLRDEYGIYSGVVSGGQSQNRTNLAQSNNKFNDIISNFSPKSKKRDQFATEVSAEIDVLIGTDCISEGQNLQDCDFLINYDIHWNPVRIVQRFGRIDRIGSTNTQIQLVNFWPNMALNAYINLIDRVKGRMEILDISATGDENIIETDVMHGELDYRTKQLIQLKERVIDLEDLQGGISITDLTFNDFKVDLDHLSPAELEQMDVLVRGHHAVVRSHMKEFVPGVIFCIKDSRQLEEYAEINPLYLYYLVYVTMAGDILYHSREPKKILDAMRTLCLQRIDDDQVLMNEFAHSVQQGKKLDSYQVLWLAALNSIKGTTERSALDSLAQPYGTTKAVAADTQDDYHLINYIVVK